MEGFIVIIYIIMLVWGILNIILFFKIWGMTNDVKEIVQILHQSKSDSFVSKVPIKEEKTEESVKDVKIVKFKNFGGVTDFKITSQNPDGTYNGVIIESGYERKNVDASLLIF